MKLTKILSLIILTQFFACKNPAVEPQEKPPHWFANYYVRYLQTERQLKAHASFLEGDSLKNAEPKRFRGGVSFQGKRMEMRNLNNKVFRYLLNEEANYSDSFLFRHRDEEGNYWEYTIKMNPIEDFFVKNEISKSKGMSLIIKGGILQENEELILLFSDQDSKAASISITGPSNTIEFFIEPEKLHNLTPGPGQLYLVKKQVNQDQEERLSAVSSIEFYSKTIDIEVLE
mgnify:CR=1 FL=1